MMMASSHISFNKYYSKVDVTDEKNNKDVEIPIPGNVTPYLMPHAIQCIEFPEQGLLQIVPTISVSHKAGI